MSEREAPERRRGGWAVPGAGKDEPGLSWEGEGAVTRTPAPAGSSRFPWRAAAVIAAGVLLLGLGLSLAVGIG